MRAGPVESMPVRVPPIASSTSPVCPNPVAPEISSELKIASARTGLMVPSETSFLTITCGLFPAAIPSFSALYAFQPSRATFASLLVFYTILIVNNVKVKIIIILIHPLA